MAVHHLKSEHDYRQLVQRSITENKLLVVYFTAAWCGPCKMMSPVYDQLSQRFHNVLLGKLDVDQVIDQLVGADKASLENKIKALSGGGSGEPSTAKAAGPGGHVDVGEYVQSNQVEALNQNMKHPVANIFKGDASYLESDCDEQLIVTIPFSQPVKLHSIQLKAPLQHAPQHIRLYVNRLGLSFDDADSVQETQRLELTEENYAEDAVIALRYVKFQNVNSLTLFIEDNLGDEDVTQLQQLVLIGSPIQTADMKGLKKMEEE